MTRTAPTSAHGVLLFLMACTTNTPIHSFSSSPTTIPFSLGRGADVTVPSTARRQVTGLAAIASATASAAATLWEFRTADDVDVPVMTDLLEQKCQFDRDLSGRPPITMKPATGDTLTSLFPELPTGQVLLIHERQTSDNSNHHGCSATTSTASNLSPPIVGFAMYALRYYGFDGSVPPSMWLHALFVEPDQRSNGAGKALMDEIAAISHNKLCSHVGWKCHVENYKGQKFYNRMGASIESQKGDLYSYAWVPEAWKVGASAARAVPAGVAS